MKYQVKIDEIIKYKINQLEVKLENITNSYGAKRTKIRNSVDKTLLELFQISELHKEINLEKYEQAIKEVAEESLKKVREYKAGSRGKVLMKDNGKTLMKNISLIFSGIGTDNSYRGLGNEN